MFSRRKGSNRAPKQPLDRSTVNAGTTAAQLAFLAQQSQNDSVLSASAAAAALRTYATTPEPVANVQTKRMVRRASNSSMGSGSVAMGNRPGLARRDSNGSMTERTFRSPSPGGQRNVVSPDPRAPPVPALPQDIARPSSSLGARARVASPEPKPHQRSASLDPGYLSLGASSRKPKRLSNVAEDDEIERAHREFSKNFSRRDIPSSPTAIGMALNGSRSPEPINTSDGYTDRTNLWISQSAAPSARYASSDAGRPSSRNSSVSNMSYQTTQPPRATRPSSATGGRMYGTATPQQQKVYDPNSRTFITQAQAPPQMSPALQAARRAKSMETVYDPNSRSFVPKYDSSQMGSGMTTPRMTSPEPPANLSPRKQRFSSFTVGSREGATSPRPASYQQPQPATIREGVPTGNRVAVTPPSSNKTPVSKAATQPTALPAETYKASTPQPRAQARSASLDVPRGGLAPTGGKPRTVSQSPSRTAHFSASPSLRPQMHAPPARGVSPAKSAMKSPASSMRTTSPTPVFSQASTASPASPPSETSEAPSLSALDVKKKANRVSFDEKPHEIRAPTPVLKSTMRETPIKTSADLDDETSMKPRPALPSFGSVRKDRVQAEPAKKVAMAPSASEGTSSDTALGRILRDNAEPVPPQSTSKEMAGYVSDASSEADAPMSMPSGNGVQSNHVVPNDAPVTQNRQPEVQDFAETNARDQASDVPKQDAHVPAISLLPPTPKLDSDDDSKRDLGQATALQTENAMSNRNSMEGISVPGGWGNDSARSSTIEAKVPDEAANADSTVAKAESTAAPVEVTQSPPALSDIEEDSDASAAFSDAYEDPSDIEDGGGFLSLDAILESPLPSPQPKKLTDPAERQVSDTPTTQEATRTPEVFTESIPALMQSANLADSSSIEEGPASPAANADWDKTTAYWSQLSQEKRAQLERSALPSDDEATPVPAPVIKSAMKKQSASPVDVTPTPTAKSRDTQPAMRKSMRAQSGPVSAGSGTDEVHMRSSMRSDGRLSPVNPPPARRMSAKTDQGTALSKQTVRPTSSGGGPPPSASASATRVARPVNTRSISDDSLYSQDGSPRAQPPKAQPRQKTTVPKASAPKPAAPQSSARLQKELAKKADDSDSESSFRKRRRAPNADGRYTMRSSMRAAAASTSPAPAPIPAEARPESPTPTREKGARYRIRSMSPSFTRTKMTRTRDSSQDPAMPATLRGSAGKPPRNYSASVDTGIRSSLRSGDSYAKPQPAARLTPAPKPKTKSRFADSDSDEEEEAPRGQGRFRSRFADSDDDSEPETPKPLRSDLAPVRGIPRRKDQEDGDSTDLEEEDDANPAVTASKRFSGLIGPHPAEMDRVMAIAKRNLGLDDESIAAANEAKEGEALHKGSLRHRPVLETIQSTNSARDVQIIPPERKKKGFMSSILRRNRNSASSVPQVVPSSPVQNGSPAVATPVAASPVVKSPVVASPVVASPVAPQSPSLGYFELPAVFPNGSPSPLVTPKIERGASPTPSSGNKLVRRESHQKRLQRTTSGMSSTPATPGLGAVGVRTPGAGTPGPGTPGPGTPGQSPSGPSALLQAFQDRDLNAFIRPKSPPIPESITPLADGRPTTSDGVLPAPSKSSDPIRPAGTRRSVSGPMAIRRVQIQAGEEGSEPGEREPKAIYSQKTGKKKKFGLLRRAFGLND